MIETFVDKIATCYKKSESRESDQMSRFIVSAKDT